MRNHWLHKVDISDVWRNDDLTLSEKASTISARMTRIGERVGGLAAEDLDDLLCELQDAAAAEDLEWFDDTWGGIYDWADDRRVWINTHAMTTATPATAHDERTAP